MDQIVNSVAFLIMDKKIDVFDIDEKEILFELVSERNIIFNGITALRVGFYKAYKFNGTKYSVIEE